MDRDKKLPEDEEVEETVPTRSIHSLEDIDANLPGRSKEDTEEEVEEIDEEEIDPLDDESEEEEKPAKPIIEEEIEEEEIEEEIPARAPVRENLEVNKAEHNLDDLADEPIDEEVENIEPREPFRRGDVGFGGNSNPNLDREPSYKTNFEPNRDVEREVEPVDDGYQEVHIPNLRSPRFNQSVPNNSNPTRSAFSQDNYTPQDPFHPTPKKRGGASKIHLLILLLIGLAVIGGTVYFLKTQFKPAAPSPTPTPSPTATPAPTPTPEPQIDRANFNIQVLNGTTTPGIAAGVITKLKELGYKTGPAGNAPKQNYTQTVISVKPGNEDLMAVLTKDISGDYEASGGAELNDTSTYDAQIILGEK